MNAGSLRVGVVAPRSVPPVEGGAERHWRSLVRGLRQAGHDAELLAVDAAEGTLAELLASYRRFHELDVSGFEVVISGKYPSWMVRHPRHLRHLNHPIRGLYDLYPEHLPLPDTALDTEVSAQAAGGVAALLDWAQDRAGDHPLQGPWARAVIMALDRLAAERISVQTVVSEAVAARPHYLPPSTPVAVIPPLTDLSPRRASDHGRPPYILAFGRLAPEKRTELAIDAISQLRRRGVVDIDLVVAGDGPEREALSDRARPTTGIEFVGRVSDDELADLIAGARAVVATAHDEDYGLVAAEAHAARRPVITTTDSGGLAEQVRGDGGDPGGLVVAPRARSLAKAIEQLTVDPTRADRLGRAGRDRLVGQSWSPLVRLVEELGRKGSAPAGRRKSRILVLAPFVAEPVVGGGARRLRAVAAQLARRHEVRVLALTNEVAATRYRLLDDGVVQLAVARSRPHLRADHEMSAVAGIPVDDIGLTVLHEATPSFAEVLAAELTDADAVILAHPFLAPALAAHRPDVPIVYDAHNVEIDLKAQLLRGRPGASKLLSWCEKAEGDALALADLVSATSETDLARLCPPGCGHRSIVAANGVGRDLIGSNGTGADDEAERRRARNRLLADNGLNGDRRPIVLFVGSPHPPNERAADALAEVGRTHPEWLVVLAGGVSDEHREGATSLGRFADHALGRILRGADVIVNPVTMGSGTNLKLIESLAVGTPVVATALGARGLPAPDEVVEVIPPWGSGPVPAETLAAAIGRVLERPGPARERAAAGRRLADQHRWDRTLAPLEEAISDLIGLRLKP